MGPQVRISVHLLPDWITPPPAQPFTAVVIDTLRFTTTACCALQAGAADVQIVQDVDAARHAAEHATTRPLLCGERHCLPIAGFDFGNSPWEYVPESVAGRALLFSTTNGTRAVTAVTAARQIVLAALVNRAAVCHWLLDAPEVADDIEILCAGTDGEVALEDVLTAGAILDHLIDLSPGCAERLVGDSAWLALGCWRELRRHGQQDAERFKSRLDARLRRAAGGANLVAAGYERDLAYAMQLDILDCVPVATGARLPVFTT